MLQKISGLVRLVASVYCVPKDAPGIGYICMRLFLSMIDVGDKKYIFRCGMSYMSTYIKLPN